MLAFSFGEEKKKKEKALKKTRKKKTRRKSEKTIPTETTKIVTKNKN